MSVFVAPGDTALTLMPEGPSSFARALIYESTAPLLAEYKASQEEPVCPHIEETARMTPFCRLIM